MKPLLGISDWVWLTAAAIALVCTAAMAVQGNL
jgi:hypothetical protein